MAKHIIKKIKRFICSLINLDMLELYYCFQTLQDYSLVDSERKATLISFPESQYGHFKHNDFMLFDSLI